MSDSLSSMNQTEQNLGAQAVFLASCTRRCIVPYSTPEKFFPIFNSDIHYSIKVESGLGIINVLSQNNQNQKAHDQNQDITKESDYNDYFEIDNGKITDCEFPNIASQAITIYDHLFKQISQLYSSKVLNLHLGFAISLPPAKIEETNLLTTSINDDVIVLTDVLSCIIETNSYYSLFSTVPDGYDIISQLVIVYTRFPFNKTQCICFKQAGNSSPQATLDLTLHYKLSELFFDNSHLDELYIYVQQIIEKINQSGLSDTISLCPRCYKQYMIFQAQRLQKQLMYKQRAKQMKLQQMNEMKMKKMNSMRLAKIRRLKFASSHGCSSNLSYQERRSVCNASLLFDKNQLTKSLDLKSTKNESHSKTFSSNGAFYKRNTESSLLKVKENNNLGLTLPAPKGRTF